MPDLLLKVWGKDEPIRPDHGAKVWTEQRVTEVHLKPGLDDKEGPTLCFVLESPSGKLRTLGKVSARMLRPAMEELLRMEPDYLLKGKDAPKTP